MTATHAVDSRVCRRCFEVMKSAEFHKYDTGKNVCSPAQECLCLGSLGPALQVAWQHAQLRPQPMRQLQSIKLQHVDCVHMVYAGHALSAHVGLTTLHTSTKPMTILCIGKLTRCCCEYQQHSDDSRLNCAGWPTTLQHNSCPKWLQASSAQDECSPATHSAIDSAACPFHFWLHRHTKKCQKCLLRQAWSARQTAFGWCRRQ